MNAWPFLPEAGMDDRHQSTYLRGASSLNSRSTFALRPSCTTRRRNTEFHRDDEGVSETFLALVNAAMDSSYSRFARKLAPGCRAQTCNSDSSRVSRAAKIAKSYLRA